MFIYKLLLTLKHDIKGATAIEYALIASLVAVAIIVSARLIGTNIATSFGTISGSL